MFLSNSNITHSMILGEVYSLMSDGVSLSGDSPEPVYGLSFSDINAIKLIPNLASSVNNTYLHVRPRTL